MNRRHYHRCQCCLAVAATEERLTGAVCGACNGPIEWMGQVGPSGKRLEKTAIVCKCDARCTHAKGPKCDCPCKGANHGAGVFAMVLRTRDVGAVPRVAIEPTGQLLRRAAEYRAALEQLTAELQRVQNLPLDAEGRMPWANYKRANELRETIGKVRRARTHGARMRLVAAVLAEFKPPAPALPAVVQLDTPPNSARQLQATLF